MDDAAEQADAADDRQGATHNPDMDFGVLLGWTAENLGERVVLRLQSAQQPLGRGETPREFTYFLKREQAVLLGNFLFQMSGATPPSRQPRGKLSRLLGKP